MSSSSSTFQQIHQLYLPIDHLPAVVLSVNIANASTQHDIQVRRDETLFTYNFYQEVHDKSQNKTIKRKRFAEFRAPQSGLLKSLHVQPSLTIDSPSFVVASILEPCGHDQIFGGMCCICGADLTVADYSNDNESSLKRAHIVMAHDSIGVKVSKREAQRLERDTTARLIERRKLSLILDLDMTVIHTISDPTVHEWKSDPNHPYHALVEDVAEFNIPGDARRYFVKLRPRTREFLESITKLYELHIYTAGSRSYANMVAQLIDPEGKLFQERILSRDESGSDKKKSLQRLFPCDQSMVLVVDDNALTWSFAANLIMIRKFNFFVGVGDINGSLHRAEIERLRRVKQRRLKELASTPAKPLTPKPKDQDAEEEEDDDDEEEEEHEEERQARLAEMERVLSAEMDNQARERPLQTNAINSGNAPDGHLLLDPNDTELEFVEKLLKELHHEFYRQWDRKMAGVPNQVKPDVGKILMSMKRYLFRGCKVVFSGLVPQGQKISETDCEVYHLLVKHGGEYAEVVDDTTTHVVALAWGTKKCLEAKQRGIYVVTPDWIVDSIARVERRKEEDYLFAEYEPDVSTVSVQQPTQPQELSFEDELAAILGIEPTQPVASSTTQSETVEEELVSPVMDKDLFDDALDEIELECGSIADSSESENLAEEKANHNTRTTAKRAREVLLMEEEGVDEEDGEDGRESTKKQRT